ncbi:16374_t:CDS:2, partial [Funneliformis geosporum]
CCDEISRNSSTFTPTPLLYFSHPEAVYHSRLLEFDEVPRSINTNRRSKLLNSFTYSESRRPFNYLLNWLHSLKKLKKQS